MSVPQVAQHGRRADHLALDRLREVLAVVLARDVTDIGPATSLHRDLGISPRQKSEFLLRLERCFGLVIEDDEASWLDTLADAVQLLCLRGAVAED
jgi:acyl carrier protein